VEELVLHYNFPNHVMQPCQFAFIVRTAALLNIELRTNSDFVEKGHKVMSVNFNVYISQSNVCLTLSFMKINCIGEKRVITNQ